MQVKTIFRTILRFFVVTLSVLVLASQAEAAGLQQLKGHVPSAVKAGARDMGRMDRTQHLWLAIALPWRNQNNLNNLLQNLYDPSSPQFRHYLSSGQFTDQFGPTEQDYQVVQNFLKSKGLTLKGTHRNRLIVDADGAVADIEKAFNVELHQYTRGDGSTFYAPSTEPSLDLATPISYIHGLDNANPPHPVYKVRPAGGMVPQARSTRVVGSTAGWTVTPELTGSGTGNCQGCYVGSDFRHAYAPGVTLDGTGVVSAVLCVDGILQSDITTYEQRFSLPNVPIQTVLIDGFDGTVHNAPNGENSLDIEQQISMAPGLKTLMLYMGSANIDDDLNQYATDNIAKTISISYGWGPDTTINSIAQQCAAQGQSVFIASGDGGAFAGGIGGDSAEETPYCTIVGGTSLLTNGAGGTWASESAWSGSGGGIANDVSIPSYQQGINMSTNFGSTTQRNLPDVAMFADFGFLIIASGQEIDNIGGTSGATPLFAAFTALANQQAANLGKPTVGFLNPTAYALGKGSSYPIEFHDIATGNNGSPTQYPAVPGYDLATGWGSPNGQTMINALTGVTVNTPTPSPTPEVGNGTGLCAQYFSGNMTATGTACSTALVPNVNWVMPSAGLTVTGCGVLQTDFSIKYTGFVQAQFNETYTFYTTTDDGVRFIITNPANGQATTLINEFVSQSPTQWSGTVPFAFVAGQKYAIEMDYFQNGGGAQASLSWSSVDTVQQIIPTSQLYPSSVCGGGPTATNTFTPVKTNTFTFTPTNTPVFTATNTPTPTRTNTPVTSSAWRIAGGKTASYTDCQSNVWSPDENYNSGAFNSSASAITKAAPCTTDQSLYQTEHWGTGSFAYTFNVPAGSYQVTLKFAELFDSAGQRIQNVTINGTQVLTNFDINADAGGLDIADDKVFNNISPVNGQVVITFAATSASVDQNAKVDALQLIPQPATPTFTFTTTRTLTFTPTPVNTSTFTSTNTPVPPTSTFTSTPIVLTATPTFTGIVTPLSTNTPTFTGTNTPVPPTATFTWTNTFTSTNTHTPVPPTLTSTNTPVPPTATFTSTNTNTLVPTNTFTPTRTNTFTPTKTNTPLPTNTPVPTNTFTSTKTNTPVPPTATPTSSSACAGVPAWNGNFVAYATGSKVTYNNELYQCIQGHTSEPNWMPPVVPALWQDLGPCSNAVESITTNTVIKSVVAGPNVSNGQPIKFRIQLTQPAKLELYLFSTTGGLVYQATIEGNSGSNNMVWNVQNTAGNHVSSGLYIYALKAMVSGNPEVRTGKVAILR